LIVAYQYLLDWYLKQYTEADEPQKHARGANPRIYQSSSDDWRLTTTERKRILLAHIYGVDIDYQAVEVTKLSLLLKALEGETKESVERMLFHKERALPDLADNIKCGNSLIGSDFYIGKQRDLFDEKEALRINAFDWKGKHGFPKIFSGESPGFDAVIGNPPYVRPHNMDAADKEYFWKHFTTFVAKSDLYCCFIERSVSVLRSRGHMGFIVSHGWLRLDSFEQLRKFLLAQTNVREIIDFTGNVFADAHVRACILIFQKTQRPITQSQ
jgi:hypothetical protein